MKKNIFANAGKALVSVIQCNEDLKQDIDQALNLIGGLQRLVKPGDTILVKPNFNTADPPPASSDPAFVKADHLRPGLCSCLEHSHLPQSVPGR